MLCRLLKLPRSSYYETLVHLPSKKEQNFLEFGKKVTLEFHKAKGRYGAPKIHQSLLRQGISCSLKRVQRHMKRLELRSITVRKYKACKSYSVVPSDKENLLKQDFTAEKPNQKWATDITYIHTCKDGWTYLASVIDLCLHKVIGYSYAKQMTASLATKALKNACLNVDNTEGIIVHSDLGSQYTSQEFEDFVATKKMLHSFSRKGNPYDNACIESFHAALKKEEVYQTSYYDFEMARKSIFEYIESWYNRNRIHSSIGYMTPQEKESTFTKTA